MSGSVSNFTKACSGENTIKREGYPMDNSYGYTQMYNPGDAPGKNMNGHRVNGVDMLDYLGEPERPQPCNYNQFQKMYSRSCEDDAHHTEPLRQDSYNNFYYMQGGNNIMDYNLGPPFLHPSDPTSYAIISPSLFQNDWSRYDTNDQFNGLQEVIDMPELGLQANNYSQQQYLPPNVKENHEDVVVSVELQESLFNRLQWYYVTCRFQDSKGNPMFCGYKATLDQSIQFVDGRRRLGPATFQNKHDENSIFISAIGTCVTTGKKLIKCKRCREKDKSLRKRKRKRDEATIWSELDEENNNKLIQLFSTGDKDIDENGELRFRIRIGCCVGVTKQHHLNHISNADGDNKAEIHKTCEGLLLTIQADLNSGRALTCFSSTPIRILGKVTDADRQKFFPPYKFLVKEEPTPLLFDPSSENPPEDIEDVGKMFKSRRNFNGCSSCAAKGDRELFSKMNPSTVKPSILMQYFSNTFSHVFENVFTKRQIMSMCNDSFFSNPPLEKFESDSPSMLQVYTILAVGACISGYLDSAERFWDRAIKLAEKLVQEEIFDKKEVLLLADGLNRVSFYFGSGGNPLKGAYFNDKSYACLEHLAKNNHPEVYDMAVYETALWSQTTYSLDENTLSKAKEWAIQRDNIEMLSYVLFLQVIVRIVPELREYVALMINNKSYVPNVNTYNLDCSTPFNELRLLFERARYSDLICGTHKYDKLIQEGFGCIESWCKGDRVKGLEQAKAAAIQSSLLEHPQFPALIPTYFACIICVKVAETKHPSSQVFIDYTELCIKSFSRISHFRWVRLIADHFIKRIDIASGRCIEMNTCPLRDRNFESLLN